MTALQVNWARQHDWFHCAEQLADGSWEVWALENGTTHPWPFRDLRELRDWAGY